MINLCPINRFKGFHEHWKLVKFGTCFKIIMGQSPNSKNYINNNKYDVLVQGNADLKNGRINPRIFTTEITKTAQKNEIIMTVRAPVGEIAINQFSEIVLGRGVCSISGNLFIYSLLLSLQNRNFWKKFSSGSTFLSVNSNDIKNLLVYMPDDNEQQKIGSFFQKLDQLIELQSQKVTQLKQLKRGFLQKLYPAKGALVNLLRFCTFNENLLNASLDDISYNQSSNIGVKDVKEDGKYPVYDVNKEIGFLNEYQSGDEYISIIKDGSNVGKVSLRPGMTSVISTMEIIHPKGVDLKYLFYKLQNINFRSFKIGTGIPHIYFKDYSKLNLLIPSLPEQQKIGTFFQNLDQQIELQQSKLNHLKQLKKGYLQNMFI